MNEKINCFGACSEEKSKANNCNCPVKETETLQSLQSCVSVSVRDLRIGNYVQFPTGSIYKVDMLYHNYESLKVWKPITLTEEWLLKFGFTQCENEYWYEKGFFGISHEGCVNLQGRGNNEFVAEAVIKYVHQLQNIYYALTGSELQIGNLTEH